MRTYTTNALRNLESLREEVAPQLTARELEQFDEATDVEPTTWRTPFMEGVKWVTARGFRHERR